MQINQKKFAELRICRLVVADLKKQLRSHHCKFVTSVNATGINDMGGKFATSVNSRWCTLICEYFRKFLKKFEMALMGYSGGWGKLIHEKNPK